VDDRGARRHFLWPVIVVVVLAGATLAAALVDPLTLRSNARLVALVLAVLGVVLVTGQTGLVSLGHGAFVGTGAFAMAVFADNIGIPVLLTIPLAGAVAAAFGGLVGLPALRLRGIQLALVTLGVAVAFPIVARQYAALTGGVTGRPVESQVEPPSWMPPPFDETGSFRFGVAVLVCLLGFWLTANLVQSRVGRAMRAVRDDDTAAAAYGVNLTTTKVGSFAFSAGLAGVAGALQVMLFPFVSHDQFTVFLSLRLYAAAIVGGVASIVGAVAGVAALVIVPAVNSALGLLENETAVFGLALIVLTFVAPGGLVELSGRLWSAVRRSWLHREPPSAEDGSTEDGRPDAGPGPVLRPTAAARRMRG
jgi:branched-chain amino acid transport system permease protein